MEPITHATSEEVHTAHDATESDSGDGHELQADNQASTRDRDPANGPMSASFVNGPYQLQLRFPATLQGGRLCSFQATWYGQLPWLEYSPKLVLFLLPLICCKHARMC